MSLWGTISFNLAVFINLIIAFFYPYNSGQGASLDTTSAATNALRAGRPMTEGLAVRILLPPSSPNLLPLVCEWVNKGLDLALACPVGEQSTVS